MSVPHIIGASVPRKEGRDKVTGAARYVDDMVLPGMLHGATVRSSVPRGKIKNISFGPGVDWNEFVVVTAKDIPGKNCIALILDDQPCLASETVNHAEEPILLLAHADRHKLRNAVEAVTIEYESLPSVHTMEESERQSTIIWGDDNILKRYLVEKGDIDAVWKEAAHIVEGEYFTGAQEQLYIENNGVIAAFDPGSGVTVWGSLQCPYYVHKALMALCGLPEDKVRVVQMETGGAFGGKEEYPSMIAGHAALLAIKSSKPVKIIYDRTEDMVATTKRHPSRTRHRTAVSKDGKILGGEIELPSMVELTPHCRPWFFRVARFTPAALITGQACASERKQWQRIRHRTALSEDSARRKAFSRWNATWTASHKSWGFRQSKFASGIS